MQQPFGPISDVFSLGCVYIEMLAIAAGISFADLCHFLEEERQAQYIQHLPRRLAWLADLAVPGRLSSPLLQRLANCCQHMISNDHNACPSGVTDIIF